MKSIIFSVVFAFSTAALAGEELVCEKMAGDAIVGLVKGLDQDVSLESTKFAGVVVANGTAHETFEVKVKGKDFSSAETAGTWKITLNDVGDGCNFGSLSLQPFDPSK